MRKWVQGGTNKIICMFQRTISVAIFGAVNSSAGLVCHIYPTWLRLNNWLDNDDSFFFKKRCHRKLLYPELRVQRSHGGDTEGIYGGWMRTIVILMQSDASDDPQSGIIYELNSHFVFRRHKEVWGLPNAIREISAERAVLSAPRLCRINM